MYPPCNHHFELLQMFNETQLFDEQGRATKRAAAADAIDEKEDEAELAFFDGSTPEDMVAVHFKTLIKMWETQLSERSEAESASSDSSAMVIVAPPTGTTFPSDSRTLTIPCPPPLDMLVR